MEQFLNCYLDQFKDAPRNSLHDRRNRKQMVEYINILIQWCAGVDNDDTEPTCKEAITTLIRYHDKAKTANGKVCMMGKYHNILYIAMKLCYLWQMKDAGWKSDFENQEENVRGLVYFLDKANYGKLELPFKWGSESKLYRFIDLPIESCGKASALKVCLQLGHPDKLLILLRFGALTIDYIEEASNFEHIMNRLMEFNHCYPYNLVACLQLLLRVVPTLSIKGLFNPEDQESQLLTRDVLVAKYDDLIQDGLIPLTRSGHSPPEMKHLCRCAIRKQLWNNFCLPHGIRQLPLPENMWRYLDILDD